jgi:class 3 adenylate cyclase
MREVETMLDHDVYRLRALRVNRSLLLVPESPCAKEGEAAGDALDVQYHSGGWTWSETTFKPGPFRLRWMNSSSQTAGVVLERVQWDPHAVTAAEVTALQEFRDLFGSEVLCPGQEIGIESVTVLFSDLKDSTRLYEITGDAPAYGHVREHFDFLKERIARTRGAVVKTIGDAVMAIFHLPEDAIQCCAEVQRDVGAFNAAWPNRPALTVKLGVHYGPAIAINANGQLDYFGRTVNIAARIARESDGGDMVVTKTLLQDERVGRVLHRHRASVVAEWTSKLRGMQEALVLCRVRIEAYNSDHEPNS